MGNRAAKYHNIGGRPGQFLVELIQLLLLLSGLLKTIPDHGQKLFGLETFEIFFSHSRGGFARSRKPAGAPYGISSIRSSAVRAQCLVSESTLTRVTT